MINLSEFDFIALADLIRETARKTVGYDFGPFNPDLVAQYVGEDFVDHALEIMIATGLVGVSLSRDVQTIKNICGGSLIHIAGRVEKTYYTLPHRPIPHDSYYDMMTKRWCVPLVPRV